MSAFRVSIEIGGLRGERFEAVEVLVDMGASYTWVPVSLLKALEIQPEEQRDFILAAGRRVQYPVATALIRVDGCVKPTPVIFGRELW